MTTQTPFDPTVEARNETPVQQTPAPLETEQSVTFASFKLPPAINQALERMKYIHPTPVQAQAIPSALEGRDVLASAQTGTGKTAAFCIPIVAKMLREGSSKALIMTPTRELAAQIMTVLQQILGNNRDIRTALLIGGESMGRQFDQLRAKPRIIVGTPGRINDHLRRAPSMLQGTDLVVLDEADRMLDMGFSVQIDTIFEKVDALRQTLMFSATFPESILKFARQYLTDPVRVAVRQKQVSADNIKHEVLNTTEATKYDDLVQQLDARAGSIIVFVKTKHGADRLSGKLEREKHDVSVIHGGLKQRQRDRAIAAFRANKVRIMVATDVAARGLDVPHIEHVINYDLPQNPEDYIHRIGRTARAGAQGNAIAFVLGSERGKWNAINRILNPGAKPERGEGGGRRHEGGKRFDSNRSEGGRYEGRGGGYKKPYNKGGQNAGGGHSGGQSNKGPRRDDRVAAPADDFFGDEGNQLVQLRHADERPHQDRPRRDRAPNDRPRGERSYNDRPSGDRHYNSDRPRHDRPHGERSFGDKPRHDRPAHAEGGKPWEKRNGEKKRTERSDNFHKQRPDDGQVRADRRDRPHHDRPRGDHRQGDRPQGQRRDFRDGNTSRPERGDRDGNRPHSAEFRADRDGNRKQAERPDRDGNRPSNGGFRKEGYPKRNFSGPKPGGKPGGFKKPGGGKRDGGSRNHRAA